MHRTRQHLQKPDTVLHIAEGGPGVLSHRYAAPLYVDIKKVVRTTAPGEVGGAVSEDIEEYPKVFIGEVRFKPCLCWGTRITRWTPAVHVEVACPVHAAAAPDCTTHTSHPQTCWRQVPIMLRSDYCSLHTQLDNLADLGECPYDQVSFAHQCLQKAPFVLRYLCVVLRLRDLAEGV